MLLIGNRSNPQNPYVLMMMMMMVIGTVMVTMEVDGGKDKCEAVCLICLMTIESPKIERIFRFNNLFLSPLFSSCRPVI